MLYRAGIYARIYSIIFNIIIIPNIISYNLWAVYVGPTLPTVIRPAIRVQVSSALRWYLSCIIFYKIEYITEYD